MALKNFNFNVIHKDKVARCGLIKTHRGNINTPAFMPVGTQATVKATFIDDIIKTGSEIILSNTYHLMLRPGLKRVESVGGLHRFMNCSLPILTDSGGFQVMSLSKFNKVHKEEGAIFKSHIDGSSHFFSPESVMAIQQIIGSNIVMPLDHCIYSADDEIDVRNSMQRTHDWLIRSVNSHNSSNSALFGIVQGGVYSNLRKESCLFESELDLPGYSIGGLAVGEDKSTMYRIVEECNEYLPYRPTIN